MEVMTSETVGRMMYANYERIREKRGFSNHLVAAMTGLHPGQLSKWKLYGQAPRNVAILKICKALGCTIQDIYEGIEGADPANG